MTIQTDKEKSSPEVFIRQAMGVCQEKHKRMLSSFHMQIIIGLGHRFTREPLVNGNGKEESEVTPSVTTLGKLVSLAS